MTKEPGGRLIATGKLVVEWKHLFDVQVRRGTALWLSSLKLSAATGGWPCLAATARMRRRQGQQEAVPRRGCCMAYVAELPAELAGHDGGGLTSTESRCRAAALAHTALYGRHVACVHRHVPPAHCNTHSQGPRLQPLLRILTACSGCYSSNRGNKGATGQVAAWPDEPSICRHKKLPRGNSWHDA
jgi:hypothetical protein